MARLPIDLPRMQNQPRSRLAAARGPNLVPIDGEAPPAKTCKRLMRQFEQADRGKQSNRKAEEDLLARAYVYAMKAHGKQKRASGDPYISHPLEVAAILTDLKLDDATIAAALLHDTIEDTDATRAEIDKLFGPEIGRLVDGLTKLKRLELVSKKAKNTKKPKTCASFCWPSPTTCACSLSSSPTGCIICGRFPISPPTPAGAPPM